MKLALFSDIHGNYQALKAIIDDIEKQDIDYTIFLGDLIGLGPKPYECLNLLLEKNIYYNYGNHELYALNGISKYKLEGLEETLIPSHIWTRKQVEKIIDVLYDDPKVDEDMMIKLNGKKIYFAHYASNYNEFLKPKLESITSEYLESIFPKKYDYIFYGHNHNQSIIKSKNTCFVCLGSSGCTKDDETFYAIVDIKDKVKIETVRINYDRDAFVNDFNAVDFPLKNIIGELFFNIK